MHPPLVAHNGAVAADHPLASKAGVEVLRRGGNAVDAACATAFALGVVNPAGSGIGGGGFMLIKRPGSADPIAIDFREAAPSRASRNMYARSGVAKGASRYGGLAVGIPGEVLGCSEAVKRYGRIGLGRVLAPAIRLARRGFPTGPHLRRTVVRMLPRLRGRAIKRLFVVGGKPRAVGQRARRSRLGRSLAAIARRGARVFYNGWIARDLVASVKRAGGILTRADLARYRIKLRAPLKTRFRGYDVHVMPPPSSGGVAIIEALNILRRHKLAALGHNSSRYLHLLSEALKHSFADRARFLGDPDFVRVPVARLTSRAYGERLSRRIKKRAGKLRSYGSRAIPARAPSRDAGTSHLSVVDRSGMAVALTTSVNTGFGSLVVGAKSGVILNNTMDDFAARPGSPNYFGLVQGEQNAVAAAKRPLSSMSPTIATRGGKVALVVGGSGGPTIITGTLQVLLNRLEFGMNAARAVSASRVHHQWLPDKLWVEQDLPADVVQNLQRRGQRTWLQRTPFTACQAVVAEPGRLTAASDPRKYGAPAGY